MGLDTSHDCWHGSYSSFMRWRREIADAAGLPPLDHMVGFGENGTISWASIPPDPIHILLNHSDCDGQIAAKDCAPLADRLEELLPNLSDEHQVSREYSARGRAEQFIRGLREAAAAGEDVDFH